MTIEITASVVPAQAYNQATKDHYLTDHGQVVGVNLANADSWYWHHINDALGNAQYQAQYLRDTQSEEEVWGYYGVAPWFSGETETQHGQEHGKDRSAFEGETLNATDWYYTTTGDYRAWLARTILTFDTSVLAGYDLSAATRTLTMTHNEEARPVGQHCHIVKAIGVDAVMRKLSDGGTSHFDLTTGTADQHITPTAGSGVATYTSNPITGFTLNQSGYTFIGLMADADYHNSPTATANVMHWYSSGHANSDYHPKLTITGEVAVASSGVYFDTGKTIILL